jgi:5-oxoprolinase (ATP-hydrolysing)
MREQFELLHLQRFGYTQKSRPIELATVRLEVIEPSREVEEVAWPTERVGQDFASVGGAIQISSSPMDYVVVDRSQVHRDHPVVGPAIILNSGSTLTVEPGWRAELLSEGSLLLIHEVEQLVLVGQRAKSESGAEVDTVLRDCYGQRLSAIATQMGYLLQQTAVSVNIKQRRDFSCAVFDGKGNLLANAPHVPVHLGAMGQTVRTVIARFAEMHPGDAFLCNDPYQGGSHLPDLTLVAPVFAPGESQPSMFVANRAHHADIGGIAPGSMSIAANRLGMEGLIIPPTQVYRSGQPSLESLEQIMRSCKYPPRQWSENLADLAAQLAACNRGCQLICDYAHSIGWTTLVDYADHLLDAAEARIRHFLQHWELSHRLSRGQSLKFADSLEDGTAICVQIGLLSDGRLHIDFSGSGPVSQKNFNANRSIVSAAVLYVLRCLVADDLPLNDGVLRAVELTIPVGVLNPMPAIPEEDCPAVAAGNVETSQRVVDVLLGALGIAAGSQGTMNNLLFGNQSFGFYETICGGAGATRTAAGADAVHTHMTNTRLTDPEVLESRYPVRLVQFCLRAGSQGVGRHCGGQGIVRGFHFLSSVDLSLITSRRKEGPFGLYGGQSGQPGQNRLDLPDGTTKYLAACCQVQLPAGSRLAILTPGGGGYGAIEVDS